ncbi:LysR family transcriptional regulator ArgP [Ciceribacter sp. L1K23]|uniref:LysR family transcriptional regulator ArgP n=1 Tax=Ciceribacter sp. L1K23 TaxID=2820276 RepID=UPI001B8403F9|nr:LysR family transcriptional regulator ArgP [Ciceribacter sp. L1K23]MBR0556559.1 LysR family transcriptional regulator ArgP [Ciceribacter sp. L1K23]
MLDYQALRALAAVVRTGSFEKAARTLAVTPSAVSQRIKQLEERVGAVLVARGTPCLATEQGAWLCRHVEQVELLEGNLMEHLPALKPETGAMPVTVSIATNADSLGTWFLAAASDFAKSSGMLLDIAVDDQDHTADWLKAGRVLAAVTGLDKPVTGCRRHPLGSLRYHATASPDFVARHFPDGVTPEALAQAPALTYNQKDRLQARFLELAFGREIAVPTHLLPSTHAFVEAALSGMGWGMNPAILVAHHLQSGHLVDLVPGIVIDTPLDWQVNRLVAGELDGLTKAVVAAGRRGLEG